MDTMAPFLVLLFLIPVIFAARRTTGRIPLTPGDFQRVLDGEAGAKVIWTKRWSNYEYYSCIGGNPIYTVSEKPLEFLETCELIPVRPAKIL